MAREEIIGALQSALARGYPLKSAMQSLYNAGYSKLEIEEAARNLNPSEVSKSAFQVQPAQISSNEKKVVQEVSNYEKSSSGSNIFIYVLGGVLVLLIGGLIATLMFKEQVVGFIKGITS